MQQNVIWTESIDGHCTIECMGTLAGARCDNGRSLLSWIGARIIRLYSRCVEVGHAEVDPSVGFSHTVPSVGVPCG